MSIIFPFTSYRRIPTCEVRVGNTGIGGNFPIRLQTMTNTDTNDITGTVEQIKRIYEAGSELVRITVPTLKEVEAIKEITRRLQKEQISIPVIADVHFVTKVAEEVAPYVQKVRINPGNYVNRSKSYKPKEYTEQEIAEEKEEIRKRLLPLLTVCKKYGTAIRIGINYASLSWRMIHLYGNTPQAMVASAMEFLEICRSASFDNLIFSFKASDIRQTIYTNRLYVKEMFEHYGFLYPIHIGITEAGLDLEGRIKSLIGIGTLLHDGIGDTIRVSLTEAPEKEIPVARKIIELLKQNSAYKSETDENHPCPFEYTKRDTTPVFNIGGNFPVEFVVTSPSYPLNEKWQKIISSDGVNQIVVNETDSFFKVRQQIVRYLKTSAPLLAYVVSSGNQEVENVSLILGNLLTEGLLDAVIVQTTDEYYSEWIEKIKIILQVTGTRRVSNEYISCPSCGRTQFDIETVARKVKEATRKFSGYKIAVMGCVVNGPGEMHDADYGFVGAGNDKVNLYYKGHLVHASLSVNCAIEELIKLMEVHENRYNGNR